MTCFNPQIMFLPKYHPIVKFADYFEKNFRQPKFKYDYQPNLNKFNKYYPVEKPCFECIGCRLDHANDWATRIYCEMMTAKVGCFVTFTYDPNNVPKTDAGEMTLKIEDTQKIWHDLRQKHPNLDIRYVIAGEYGIKSTKRPHYHACIFGYEPTDLKYYKNSRAGEEYKLYKSKELTKLWGKGIVIIGKLEYKSACYVARYVQKKAGLTKIKKQKDLILDKNEKAPSMQECIDYAKWLFDEKERQNRTGSRTGREDKKINKIKRLGKMIYKKSRLRWKQVEIKDPNKRKEEFILSSLRPAIGLQYWEENKEKIKANGGIFVKFDKKIKLKKIPNYFKKKWKEENPEEYFTWAYMQQRKAQEQIKYKISQMKLPQNWSYTQKLNHLRKLEKSNLLNKIKKSNLATRENFA